jgi:hypothetical protein
LLCCFIVRLFWGVYVCPHKVEQNFSGLILYGKRYCAQVINVMTYMD